MKTKAQIQKRIDSENSKIIRLWNQWSNSTEGFEYDQKLLDKITQLDNVVKILSWTLKK